LRETEPLIPVSVENRIVKVQKRNRALVRFDGARICRAILRAGQSIGGLQQDHLPGINAKLFEAWKTDEELARFLADLVIILLNSEPQHLIANFPPTIEQIQDAVLHALRSYGFQNTADAYACYRWGRHWLREGAISNEQFVGNGIPQAQIQEKYQWNRQHGCDTVTGLNALVRSGKLQPLIRESLLQYDRSIAKAEDKIVSRLNAGHTVRMIWVTGPSSAGKTTTTVKLAERLQRRGMRFVTLNLDDYFWSLVEHPTDWINDRNYETPQAMDIQLLNEHLRALLEGKTIEKPVFDFKSGRRVASKPVRLEKDEVLLLDCLHGLYPPLTEGIPASDQFRVFVDAQTSILEGNGETRRLTASSDLRLMRRMIRDARHRNHSPLRTLLHWHYVRAGELFSILPLRGAADHIIDTGLGFELAVLKPFFCGAETHLPKPEDFEFYRGFLDASIRYNRLSSLLNSVEGLPRDALNDYELLPGDAVLREFIGGSTLSIPHNE
jgi:uridine kinase